MSLSRLVEERKRRIQTMEDIAKKEAKKWILKKRFFAIYMYNTGVRKRVADEYYQILVDMGLIEEKQDDNVVMIKCVD